MHFAKSLDFISHCFSCFDNDINMAHNHYLCLLALRLPIFCSWRLTSSLWHYTILPVSIFPGRGQVDNKTYLFVNFFSVPVAHRKMVSPFVEKYFGGGNNNSIFYWWKAEAINHWLLYNISGRKRQQSGTSIFPTMTTPLTNMKCNCWWVCKSSLSH